MACVHVWLCFCHVCVYVFMCVGCVLAVTLSEMQNPVCYVAITMVIVEVCIGAMYKLTHHSVFIHVNTGGPRYKVHLQIEPC